MTVIIHESVSDKMSSTDPHTFITLTSMTKRDEGNTVVCLW